MADASASHRAISKLAGPRGGKPAAATRTYSAGFAGIMRDMFPDNLQPAHAAPVELARDEFAQDPEDTKPGLLDGRRA